MKSRDIIPAWGRILSGHKPFLALEITKECPLRCPGCYSYQPNHVGEGIALGQIADFRGRDLVERCLALVRQFRPIHVSIVGGEPLMRWRELDVLLPELGRLCLEVQLVTSAVRSIPVSWRRLENLELVVSVDGLQPEHDLRRAPATYRRILENISGHTVTVHCTLTKRLLSRREDLKEFTLFWSSRDEVRKIWFSLYTPQESEKTEERLSPQDRVDVLQDLRRIREESPKVHLPNSVLDGFVHSPRSPEECIFAQVTTCMSADLASLIAPCQLGGRPVCAECGCMAAAGFTAIGNYRLGGLVRLRDIFAVSRKVGLLWARLRGIGNRT